VHILLTDVLCCPRCGPEHGLIVLADRLVERRVLEGRLGCANCRASYPVRGGTADLRLAVSGESASEPAGDDGQTTGGSPDTGDDEAPVRIAALLDLGGGPTMVLLAGAAAAHAAGVARLVPDVEVIALDLPGAPPEGVSALRADPRTLPFRSYSLRAVALGAGSTTPPAEGLRLLAVGGRLLLEGVLPGVGATLEAGGARVLLEQDGIAVASRERLV
jgi:uncharacterized protein YbaR (Trm112 family)